MRYRKKESDQQNKADEVHLHQSITAADHSTVSGASQEQQVNVFIDRIPRWLLVAFLLIALLIIGATYWIIAPLQGRAPDKMSGDFKIAVAGFAVQGENADESLGEAVANKVSLGVEQAFDEFDFAFTEEIWGPEQVGSIDDEDRQERAKAAAQLAERVDANVVVYGLIDATNPTWNVMPEFYIHDLSAADAIEIQGVTTDQSVEMAGQHEFGRGIPIPKGSDGDQQITVGRAISERTQLLARLLKGIAYYATRHYDWSYEEFAAIEETEAWPDDFGGRHLLYLLLGNAAGRTAYLEDSYDLDQAADYYEQALDEKPEYDRALAGLGNVYFMRALAPANAASDMRQVDPLLLEQSIAYYQRAAGAPEHSPLADMEAKVHFGLGQVYLIQSYADESVMVAPAIAEFEKVIELYADGENPRLDELAAESYLRLGTIYAAGGDADSAVAHLQRSVALFEESGNLDRRDQAAAQLASIPET